MSLWRVRTVFSGPQGSPYLSTLYFDASGGSAQQAATAVGAFWGAIDNYMTTVVNWTTEGDVTEIDEATGNPVSLTSTTPVTGSGSESAAQLPIATQGLIRTRTGVFMGGREIRGRVFVPSMTEAENDFGKPNAATVTAMNTAAAALVASANAQWMVWSKTKGTSAGVLSATAWDSWAVLRSRRD